MCYNNLHCSTLSVSHDFRQAVSLLVNEDLPEIHVTLTIRHNGGEVAWMKGRTDNNVTEFLHALATDEMMVMIKNCIV